VPVSFEALSASRLGEEAGNQVREPGDTIMDRRIIVFEYEDSICNSAFARGGPGFAARFDVGRFRFE
jgi:hypothetical protein